MSYNSMTNFVYSSGGSAPCAVSANLQCAVDVWKWGGGSFKLWSTCGGCNCCSPSTNSGMSAPPPHLPISPSPHLPISPSPHLPISPSPHLPLFSILTHECSCNRAKQWVIHGKQWKQCIEQWEQWKQWIERSRFPQQSRRVQHWR